jgi:WD40 repeat protein
MRTTLLTILAFTLSACGGQVSSTASSGGAPGPAANVPPIPPSERPAVAASDPNDVWLAFDASSTESDVYVVRADGSDLHRLDLGMEASAPSFSPNGNALAYAGPGGIWVRDLTTGQSQQLTHGNDGVSAWSPDGKLLAFTRGVDIWLIGADGSGERVYIKGPPPGEPWYSNYGHPVFTRDGAALIFDKTGALQIGAVDGSGVRDLLTRPVGIVMATVSPDGMALAFSSEDCGIRVVPLATGGLGLPSVSSPPLPTCVGAQLDASQFVTTRPAWSTNGLVAYSTFEKGLVNVVPAAGGVPRSVVDTKQALSGQYVAEVSWSPPGTVLR